VSCAAPRWRTGAHKLGRVRQGVDESVLVYGRFWTAVATVRIARWLIWPRGASKACKRAARRQRERVSGGRSAYLRLLASRPRGTCHVIASPGVTSRTRQIATKVSRLGSRRARSIRLMCVRWSPASAASCSWLRPRARRAARTRNPKSLVMARRGISADLTRARDDGQVRRGVRRRRSIVGRPGDGSCARAVAPSCRRAGERARRGSSHASASASRRRSCRWPVVGDDVGVEQRARRDV
jgi:hypothetical protein